MGGGALGNMMGIGGFYEDVGAMSNDLKPEEIKTESRSPRGGSPMGGMGNAMSGMAGMSLGGTRVSPRGQ